MVPAAAFLVVAGPPTVSENLDESGNCCSSGIKVVLQRGAKKGAYLGSLPLATLNRFLYTKLTCGVMQQNLEFGYESVLFAGESG